MIDPKELLMNLKQSPQPNGYYMKDIADVIEFLEAYLKEKEESDNYYNHVGASLNPTPMYHRTQDRCVYSTAQTKDGADSLLGHPSTCTPDS
jgi:hypothetical protein